MASGSTKFKNSINLDPQSTDPSSPAEGDLQFSDGTARAKGYWQYKDGAWAEFGGAVGAGGINYLEGDNTNAENGVGDWVTYADAAGENPVDGTGGSATITFTQNTTTPLRGTGDFKFTKDAANRQGEGASVDFTIEKADQAQKLTISFDYDASAANYADDDIRISVYDVTNTNLIRINGEDLKGGKGTHYAQFQTAVDSTSYRLIIHQSSTNATAYDIYLDNISVGPSKPVGTSQEVRAEGQGNGGTGLTADVTNIDFTETVDTTASFDGAIFTAPETGTYQVEFSVQFTASVGNSIIEYIDGSSNRRVGFNPGSATIKPGSFTVNLNKGQTLSLRSNGAGTLSNSTSAHWLSITKISFSEEANAVGSGRDVITSITESLSQSLTDNTTTKVGFTSGATVTADTTAAWDTSNLRININESGYYDLTGRVSIGANAGNIGVSFYKDGGTTYIDGNLLPGTSLNTNGHDFSMTALKLEKGDNIEMHVYWNDISGSSSITLTSASLTVAKRNSAQATLDTAQVSAQGAGNAATVITANTTNIDFTETTDSHGAFDGTTFTAPKTSFYIIEGAIRYTTSAVRRIDAYIDAVQGKQVGFQGASSPRVIISAIVKLNKGEALTFRCSGGGTLNNDSLGHHLSIVELK
jgi:hypothetical protein